MLLLAAGLLAAAGASARTLEARIARVQTPAATLDRVTVALDWPASAPTGQLTLRAASADACSCHPLNERDEPDPCP